MFIPVSPMEISDKEAPNRSIEDLHKIAKKDQDSVTSLYLNSYVIDCLITIVN